MTELFTVNIVTPAGKHLEAKTTELTLSNSDGQITILPAHIEYASLLGSGVLSFTDSEGNNHQFVTSGGFCNFSTESVTVLTDYVDYSEDVDQTNLSAEIKRLEDQLGESDLGSPESRLALSQLDRYKAQLELISH